MGWVIALGLIWEDGGRRDGLRRENKYARDLCLPPRRLRPSCCTYGTQKQRDVFEALVLARKSWLNGQPGNFTSKTSQI